MRRCKAGQLGDAWGTLLGAFERSILHTHRSKFTQFLLWFLADKVPATVPLGAPAIWVPCSCRLLCCNIWDWLHNAEGGEWTKHFLEAGAGGLAR